MALGDDFSARDLALGFGLGLAAAAAFPGLAPAIRGVGRPLVKSAIRAALVAADGGRERLAEMQETLEDLIAEVQHELASEETAGGNGSGVGPNGGARA